MEKKDWEKHGIYKLQDYSEDKCCSFHVHYYVNLEAHIYRIIQNTPYIQPCKKGFFYKACPSESGTDKFMQRFI